MTTKHRISSLAVLAAFAMACADPSAPTRALLGGDATLAVSSVVGHPFPIGDGAVQLCKTSNVAGDFDFDATGPAGIDVDPDITIGAGGGTVCVIIYTSTFSRGVGGLSEGITITETTNANLTNIDIVRYLAPAVVYTAPELADSHVGSTATIRINNDMARKVTFTNTTAPPPPAICDFITFGRLVDEVGGLKVVISGNAGGFNADGSIKGEFHIEVNGTDHHVHDVATYGPIAAAPLASSSFTNSRVVTGLDIHGHSVELRLWDGGEPGKDTDRYWFNVNGTIVGNATSGNLIDQGNMQYHPTCRGPDQD